MPHEADGVAPIESFKFRQQAGSTGRNLAYRLT